MIEETEKKAATVIINLDTGLEHKKKKKNVFISVSYVPGLSEEFRRIFWNTSVQVSTKGANTLKSILNEDKIPLQLKQSVVCK